MKKSIIKTENGVILIKFELLDKKVTLEDNDELVVEVNKKEGLGEVICILRAGHVIWDKGVS
jgi:hypothetical protein